MEIRDKTTKQLKYTFKKIKQKLKIYDCRILRNGKKNIDKI